ncbi:uncharacterized protein J3D65DRAFT_672542 [Phyllosticta citribraziliensis]|uniref:GATA-type domain-containing protein n=1 Tax=Phyllosticta citribraziliensis TaxID=989973 RepID=A0ABR1L712_9PEZI
MDTTARKTGLLPSIAQMDSEKARRDEADFHRKHSVAAMVSPSSPYTHPPPPPYARHPPNATAPPPSLAGLVSPPDSRRTSGDEQEQKPAPVRQSLPSIHEALGSDQPMVYPHTSAPPPASHFYPPPPPPSVTSHHDPGRRPFQESPAHFAAPPPPPPPRSPFVKPPQPPYSAPYQEPPRPALISQNPSLSTLHPLRTEPSPVNGSRPPANHHYQSLAPYDQNPPTSGPPPQSQQQQQQQPFGYTTYPASHPYSAPPPPPPPSNHGAPPYPAPGPGYATPRPYPPTWRSDGAEVRRAEESKRAGRNAGPAMFGESVKRHLDNFDFEASLNEIAEGTGRLNEFLRVYGQRAHQAQRTGPVPGSTPPIQEVDDMMKQGHRIVDSLVRIREVVLTTQQNQVPEQPQDPRFKATNGFDAEESSQYGEDTKGAGGFAGGDSKKRRGRAAPPGRCHSCNRAETPEWRRGPDGARTLCNACGLHYAKLTRKMGANANKAPIGSSNLRPKSLGPGSPPA